MVHFPENSTCTYLQNDHDFLLMEKLKCEQGKLQFETNECMVIIPYISSGKILFIGDKEFCASSSTTNFIYLPKGVHRIEMENHHADLYVLFIHYQFIKKNIGFLDLERGVQRKFLVKTALNVGEKDLMLLREITENKFPHDLHKLIQKKKLLELLIDKLYQIEHKNKSKLRDIEIQRMEEVKNIIEERFTENLTISILAREVGTNEQYLKQHFKHLYGKTIYNYLLSRRMSKAKELLLTKKYKISDVAELTGYKHATHFTTIFKKYFGHRPNEFK